MSAPIPARPQQDESILIDNVNGSGLTLGLFGVIGLTWTLHAAGAGAHGWMLAGITVATLALLAGLIGAVIARPRSRARGMRRS
ncbi:hypothetical protein HLB23_08390 [Nocardia uniformis]|uniref:Uncharacterized protein n=1 Tax=Nocardia uniformis TaxID=53432 RepID=A0A849C058_9NOCA|nr:hypothetical protein [Nocardia uniformis]NNH69880.1 hypothetical protein [Nocardia uniformis]